MTASAAIGLLHFLEAEPAGDKVTARLQEELSSILDDTP